MKLFDQQKGFTLIEILLVIAIMAILAAIVIVAINPAKQFGEAQNAQRSNDVRAILDAVIQYSLDNDGSLPGGITTATDCLTGGADICAADTSCEGTSLDELISNRKYLTELPEDPTNQYSSILGYSIMKNSNGRVTVCAKNAYDNAVISVTR